MGLFSNLLSKLSGGGGHSTRCQAVTATGVRCKNLTTSQHQRCRVHATASPATAAELIAPGSHPRWEHNDPFEGAEEEVVLEPEAEPKLEPAPPKKGAVAAAPAEPGKTSGLYGHANDAVRPPNMVDLSRVEHLRGRNVVTIDLDGTVYNRENCCPKGKAGPEFGWSDTCDHVKWDTVEDIEAMCAEHDAVPVILSWRGGATDASRQWLDHVGVDYDAVFIPGSEDDIAGLELHWTKAGKADHTKNRQVYGGGQVAFKQATVTALHENVGAQVVASYDDNPKVVEALSDYGVEDAVHVRNAAREERERRKASWGGKGGSNSCLLCGETFDGVNTRRGSSWSKVCVDCSSPTSPSGGYSSTSPATGKSARDADDVSARRDSWMPLPFDERDIPSDTGFGDDGWPDDGDPWEGSEPLRGARSIHDQPMDSPF